MNLLSTIYQAQCRLGFLGHFLKNGADLLALGQRRLECNIHTAVGTVFLRVIHIKAHAVNAVKGGRRDVVDTSKVAHVGHVGRYKKHVSLAIKRVISAPTFVYAHVRGNRSRVRCNRVSHGRETNKKVSGGGGNTGKEGEESKKTRTSEIKKK